MKLIEKKISKIIKDIRSLDKKNNIRYVFSYIRIGNNLNDLESDTVTNIDEDIPSNVLTQIIDEKIFNNPIVRTEEEVDLDELTAKLHMFNLFNNGKKFKA